MGVTESSLFSLLLIFLKGGQVILGLHAWSLARALEDVYPQLGPMNEEEFDDIPCMSLCSPPLLPFRFPSLPLLPLPTNNYIT